MSAFSLYERDASRSAPNEDNRPKAEVQSKEISALDRPFGGPLRGFIANVERIREYGG